MTIENILKKQKYIRADLEIKAKELNIKGYTKLNKQKLIDLIIETVEHEPQKIIQKNKEENKKENKEENKKVKKQTISKVIKNEVWDKFIGKEKGIGDCFCCNKNIDSKHFECGHIIAESEGGIMAIDNLRPICSLCNKSMGATNMLKFKDKLHQESKVLQLSKILKEYKFLDECPKKENNIIRSNRDFTVQQTDNSEFIFNKIHYDNILYDNIKNLYCHKNNIDILVNKYDIGKTKDYKYFINSEAILYSDYLNINKEKLVRWFNDINISINDLNYKIIMPKTHEELLKKYCCCKNTYSFCNFNSLDICDDYKYINQNINKCNFCGDVTENKNNIRYNVF